MGEGDITALVEAWAAFMEATAAVEAAFMAAVGTVAAMDTVEVTATGAMASGTFARPGCGRRDIVSQTKEDPVKYWAGVRQCISDLNKATSSLQLALACRGEPGDFVSVSLTKRQIAMLLVLLDGALVSPSI